MWNVKAGEINGMTCEHFIEQLSRYEKDSPFSRRRNFRKDMLGTVKRIKCPILRWCGGDFVPAYHWQGGISLVDKEPKLLNYT